MKNIKTLVRLLGSFLIATLFFSLSSSLQAQDTYTKITSEAELVTGEYLIANADGSYLLGYQTKNSNRKAIATNTTNQSTLTVTTAKTATDEDHAYVIAIEKIEKTDQE